MRKYKRIIKKYKGNINNIMKEIRKNMNYVWAVGLGEIPTSWGGEHYGDADRIPGSNRFNSNNPRKTESTLIRGVEFLKDDHFKNTFTSR